MKNNRPFYAIDFGTSNSLLASTLQEDMASPVELDPSSKDPTILRSLMYFSSQKDHIYFGNEAIEKYVGEGAEGRFLRSVKKYLPSQSFVATQVGGQLYSLEELIACFLREMKSRADQVFESNVTSVVLGRPAKFSLDEKSDQLAEDRLKKAALLAGFNDIHFLPEPLAAAYDYRRTISQEKVVLVVDLGGGTSDFTIASIEPGKSENGCEVLGMGGVPIAGNALDGAIMGGKLSTHFGAEIKYRMPLGRNILTMPAELKQNLMSPADITLMQKKDIMIFLKQVQKGAVSIEEKEKIDNLFFLVQENLGFSLYEAIEELKRSVCRNFTQRNQVSSFEFEDEDLLVEDNLTYQEFMDFSSKNIDSIFSSLNDVMKMAELRPDQVDSICCTGGTSRVPEVRLRLESLFGKDKIETFNSFHSVIGGLVQYARQF